MADQKLRPEQAQAYLRLEQLDAQRRALRIEPEPEAEIEPRTRPAWTLGQWVRYVLRGRP